MQADGAIASTHPYGRYRTRFVNSSLGQFRDSLALCRDRYAHLAGLDDSAAAAVIATWKRDLATIDPAALSGPDTWWAVILEQLEDGLL